MVIAKRKRDDDDDDVNTQSPQKLHTRDCDVEIDEILVQTPSKRARSLLVPDVGTPRSILKKTGNLDVINGTTPKSNRKLAFETPTKSPLDDLANGSPTIVRNADRSARRKSNRRLFEPTLNGLDSDDEALDEEEMLAQQILSDQEEEKEPEPELESVPTQQAEAEPELERPLQDETPVPETPSKRGRGRPKGTGHKQRAALQAQKQGESAAAPASGAEHGTQDGTNVHETPSKRGRGRPKGSGWRQKAALVAEQNGEIVGPDPNTPKRGRGRPKGSFKVPRERPSSPSLTMPSHEEYFWQNRPGGTKTSDNTLPSGSLLNHDEYFQTMQNFQDHHENEMNFLLELHSRAYDQWLFELEQGFNICLYGYGSKRPITEKFTANLYHRLAERAPYKGTKKTPKITIVNGYSSGTTIKDILATIASIAIPSQIKTPNQPASLLEFILNYLSDHPPAHAIPVIINSIDSPYLRKSPTPSMLAQLASHTSINLVCTADTPNFALLWDVGLKSQYKFIFHDATTFAPYDAEIDVVESVNDLLGRSGRRVSGRDGVGFVLRSLPENARSLFRILVMEQLAVVLMDEGAESDQEGVTAASKAKGPTSESTQGVEYRVLYHKAVEEFVCSSEVGFRTLLKEFHDHQMIESRKDGMGTERLWIPFRQEELEGLAEDLAGDAF